MLYVKDEQGNLLSKVPSEVDHLFGLVLNPMTDRTEAQTLVAVSTDRDELVKFWKEQEVDRYTTDDQWNKVYKKGGPLEWYNPPRYHKTDEDPKKGFGADPYGNGIIELKKNAWQRVG